jgi:uncharacterized MAPEG superfamily protein
MNAPIVLAIANHAAAAYSWALLLAAAVVVASLVPLGAARSRAGFTVADLAAPRAMLERLPAWGKRANWAHQNSFEAFTLFAPAALLCVISAPQAPAALVAAWLHPLLRLAYIAAYVADRAALRSLCWAGAMVCTGVLYVEGCRMIAMR